MGVKLKSIALFQNKLTRMIVGPKKEEEISQTFRSQLPSYTALFSSGCIINTAASRSFLYILII